MPKGTYNRSFFTATKKNAEIFHELVFAKWDLDNELGLNIFQKLLANVKKITGFVCFATAAQVMSYAELVNGVQHHRPGRLNC